MARIVKYFRNIPSRTAEYFKLLGNDYKSAVVDACKDGREKPVKTGVISIALAGFAYAYKTNPTKRELLNELAEKRQILATLPNTIHNVNSDQALSQRTNYLNQNRLRYIDCFFFSLLTESPSDNQVRVYESQDTNLKKWWFEEIYANFLDIGIFGKWYNLNNSFIDYDVNVHDLYGLPESSNKN